MSELKSDSMSPMSPTHTSISPMSPTHTSISPMSPMSPTGLPSPQSPTSSSNSDIKYITVQAFNWETIDKGGDDDQLVIYCWAHTRDSKPVLVRIEDSPADCYIELPILCQGRKLTWTLERIEDLMDTIGRFTSGLIRYECVGRRRLYYYEPPIFMIKIWFKNLECRRATSNKLKNPINVKNIGILDIKMWEDDIQPLRQLLTRVDMKSTQPFKFNAKLTVNDSFRVSTINEYIISYKDIIPISDSELKDWYVEPKIMAFDIESYTTNHKAMPNPLEANHVAFAISCVTTQGGKDRKYYCILMGDCKRPRESKLTYTTIKVRNELELVNAFGKVVVDEDPDILTGFNINNFDWLFLNERLERMQWLWPSMGRLHGKLPVMKTRSWESSGYGRNFSAELEIPGRISVDEYVIVRRSYKLIRYNLDTVASKFLKKTKLDVKPKRLFLAYEAIQKALILLYSKINPEVLKETPRNGLYMALDHILVGVKSSLDLINLLGDQLSPNEIKQIHDALEELGNIVDYCIVDSDLVIDIWYKLNIWADLSETARVVGITPVDTVNRGQQIRVISQIYDCAERNGFVLTRRESKVKGYKGATVIDPKLGYTENVLSLDFASLYPSIMMAYNICYTTLQPQGAKLNPETDNILSFEEKDSKFKYGYNKQIKGILPQILTNLINERKATRDLLKSEKDPIRRVLLDKRQLALKVSANSVYGFTGADTNRYPIPECSRSVTGKGRELIMEVKDYVEKKYNAEVVYGDTDSCMIDLKITDPKDVHKWGMRISEEISALFPPPLKLEFEHGKNIIMLGKKYYVYSLINEHGNVLRGEDEIVYKGVTVSRRDNCEWVRKIYRKLIAMIFDNQPFIVALEYVINAIWNLLCFKIDLPDLIFVRSLGDNYKQANFCMNVFGERLRNEGKQARAGDRLEYIIIRTDDSKDKLGAKMMRPEDYIESNGSDSVSWYDHDSGSDIKLRPFQIDFHYYISHSLKGPITQILAIGYNKDIEKIKHIGFKQSNRHKMVGFDDPIEMLYRMVICGQDIRSIISTIKPLLD